MPAASPNNTVVIIGRNNSIVDAGGYTWTIDAVGKINVNGVVDPTSDQVKELAYVNGNIYQENVNGDWWQKGFPASPWVVTSRPILPASPDKTVVIGSTGYLVDSAGNAWSIDSTGKALVNGRVDPTTDQVKELVFTNGQVYQENVNGDWWKKYLPSDAWTVSPQPLIDTSPNNTSVLAGSNNLLIDPRGNIWTIDASGKILVNGLTDVTTDQVIEVALVNGKVWQQNINHDWWQKTVVSDTWLGGTKAGPVDWLASIPASALYVSGVQSIVGNIGDIYYSLTGVQPTIYGSGIKFINGNKSDYLTFQPGNHDNTVEVGPGGLSVNFKNGTNEKVLIGANESVSISGSGNIGEIVLSEHAKSLTLIGENTGTSMYGRYPMSATFKFEGVTQAEVNAGVAGATYIGYTASVSYQSITIRDTTLNLWSGLPTSQFIAV